LKVPATKKVAQKGAYDSSDKFTLGEDDSSSTGGREDMAKKTPFRRCLDGYVQYMKDEARLAERSIKEYRWAIIRCHDIVREGGGPDNPLKVSKDDLRYLFDHIPGTINNRKYNWAIYSGFLKWCGNEGIHRFKPRWPSIVRINVDWLEPEQADILRETATQMDPLTALIVHLELDLCLRRIEIQRLRVQDIHKDRIDVLGKGRLGGKPRTVSLIPGESEEYIGNWMAVRTMLEAQTNGPKTDKLVVYLSNNELMPYQRSALDQRLKKLQEESGLSFRGHHTLRRTGGRLLWLAGVPIETIASVMGHESTDTTLQYIGVNLGDQIEAFEAVKNARIQRSKIAENVPFLYSQKISGPNGI